MMRYTLKAYSIQEYGQRKDAQGRPHQEDSIFPLYGQQTDADRLFILCDGMGGHDAGEVASATVCEAMSQSVMASVPDSEALFTDTMLRKAVADAFSALDAKDNGAAKKMGTTMTFLKLHAGGATIAHMGDSRVYHIRPGKDADSTRILFETEDHSLVNDLVKVGELTPEEARHSPQKNIITRAMQPHMDRPPKADVYHTCDIQPGDYFYLCSDGMLEQMEDDNIRFNFSDMNGDDANKVQVLTNATIDNRDNHTALIIHILDVQGEPDDTDIAPAAASTAAAAAATTMASPATFTADAVDDPDESTTQPAPPTQPVGPYVEPMATPRQPQYATGHESTLRKGMGMERRGKGIEGKNKFLWFIIAAALLGIAFAAVCLFQGIGKKKTECPTTEQTTRQPEKRHRHKPAGNEDAATQQGSDAATTPAQGNIQEPAPQQDAPGKPESTQPNKPNAGAPGKSGTIAPNKPADTPASKPGANTPGKAEASQQQAAPASHNEGKTGVEKIREEFGKRNQGKQNTTETATDATGKKQ